MSCVFAVWNQITISQMRRSLFLNPLSSDRGATSALGQHWVSTHWKNYEQNGQNISALSDWLSGSNWKPSSRFSGMFGLCFPDGRIANNFHKRRWTHPAVVKMFFLFFFLSAWIFSSSLMCLARSCTRSGQVWRVGMRVTLGVGRLAVRNLEGSRSALVRVDAGFISVWSDSRLTVGFQLTRPRLRISDGQRHETR